jgi:eukaryotic-like serine/threonine-protein kinase
MAGEYRLLRKLGEGGFGAVFEAEHPVLKRRAAVKVLHRVADKDSDAVLRFISEAQAVNQIRNRHIVDVFSFGQLADGRHFYVMDLLDGVPLDRFLSHVGRVNVETALALLSPIAEALDSAHGAGIVHRDLKPQNIFLSWDASGETVLKLLDFGMAKLLGESPVHTVSGTPIGTPLYMSPEQARGERVDLRSDVYALGVLAYELITGQLPFVGDTTVAVLMAHVIQAPPRASETCPEVPASFDAPLLCMLDKDPLLRPASAGAAVAALVAAAREAGIEPLEPPLRLARPDVAAPDNERRDTAQVFVDDFADTEPVSPSLAQRARRPLWPFALGLVGLGVGLGFAVLRPADNGAGVQPRASAGLPVSTTPEGRVTPPAPSAAAPSTSRVDAPAPSERAPSPAAPSVAPTAAAAPEKKPASRPNGPTPIPTDLENPFQ